MAEKDACTGVQIKTQGADSGNHPVSMELPEDANSQSAWSIEDEEDYAREGMITFLSDPAVAMEHFRAGMERGQSPVVHYGYAFVFFVRAMVSFNEAQQDEAYRLLENVSTHCHKARKRLPKDSIRRLYYATLEHDCELFLSFLQFLKETMTGYIKGGLGIRKVWKSYAKTFKKGERLFSSRPHIRPPFSDSDETAELDSEAMKQLRYLDTEESDSRLVEVDLGAQDGGVSATEEDRVRRAVYMGYGTFHLILSLIPQKFLKLANLLGFHGDRRFGLECLQFGLTGRDMRQPIAAINLLWFHTLLIPLISLSGPADVSSHVEEVRALLCHLTDASPNSPLACYFSAHISLITRDIDVAMAELKLAGQGSFFPREMQLVTCQERTFLAMLQNNFQLAHELIQSIINTANKFLAIYLYLSGLLTGYLTDAREALKLFENGIKQESARSNPIEKFSLRRCQFYTKQGVTYVGMHMALLEQLYLANSFRSCSPTQLAANLESVQSSVASATDPLARCLGLLTQGSVLKYLGCPNEAEQSFAAIISCGPKQLKNEKHILVFANIEMAILARTHRKDAGRSISFLHTARDKYGDYDFDGRIQLIINRELSLSKTLRRISKTDN